MQHTSAIHPMAPHHLPNFIPTAAGDDWLFTMMTFGVVLATLLIGVGYLSLHSLPERMMHKRGASAAQFQLVGILALLALFTHNNLFWISALLLAVIRLPDLVTPLNRIADALARPSKDEPSHD